RDSRAALSHGAPLGVTPLSQAIPTPVAPPLEPVEPVEPVGQRSLASRLGGLAFIAPALIVLGLFLVYPAYYTIPLSLYHTNLFYRFTHWVGLDNFKNLLTNDPDFLDTSKFHGFNVVREILYKNDGGALINNVHWVVFYITLALVFGLGFAVLAVRVRYERIV